MGKYPLMFSADNVRSHFQQIVSLLRSAGGSLPCGVMNLPGRAPSRGPLWGGSAKASESPVSPFPGRRGATGGREWVSEGPLQGFVRPGQNGLQFGALFIGLLLTRPRPRASRMAF